MPPRTTKRECDLRAIAAECRHRAARVSTSLEHESLIAQAREFEAEALEIHRTRAMSPEAGREPAIAYCLEPRPAAAEPPYANASSDIS